MEVTPQETSLLRVALKKVSFLGSLRLEELDTLIGALEKRAFAKGEVIIKQGAPGDAFYIIGSGTVAIVRERLWGKKRVAVRSAGEFIGEMALVRHEPRNATAVGEEPGTVYRLSRETFEAILLKNPSIAAIIRKTSVQRLREDERNA